MKRRDFLQGSAAFATMGVAGSAKAAAQAVQFIGQEALIAQVRSIYCGPLVKERRNIYSLLGNGDPKGIIQAYRDAVGLMKQRPSTDPLSWAYQANIHGTPLSFASWPAGVPWFGCQHWSNYFFSWHRMYLHFFERILIKVLKDANKPLPVDFALPYWDYGQTPDDFNFPQAILPQPFRDPTIGGVDNALYDGTRDALINDSDPTKVQPLNGSAVNYGELKLHDGDFYGFQSALEGTPHGSVHSAFNGNMTPSGWVPANMTAFETAALDPIFWLHHCNIDRLWERWLSRSPANTNPTDFQWLNGSMPSGVPENTLPANRFFDVEQGALVQKTSAQVMYTVNQLGYRYEDDPFCAAVPLMLLAQQPSFLPPQERRNVATVVLGRNLKIPPGLNRFEVKAETAGAPAREALAKILSPEEITKSRDAGHRLSIVFEGVRTSAPLGGYFEVYINLPKDVQPHYGSRYYVGNLVTFGADQKSRRGAHAGHADRGLIIALNVTDKLKNLVDRGEVVGGNITLTLVPTGVTRPGETFRFHDSAKPEIDAIVLSIEGKR